MNTNNPNKSELLLPAGDMDSCIAAVQNNADAVYLGQKSFSARQSAINFDKDELKNAVMYCHTRGVKVYQTLNTLVFDNQINDVINTLENACKAGVDAIIVQDFGVVQLIKECCPTMRIHASTQMAVHTLKGAMLLKELGFQRVVLARELSLKQIKEITDHVDIETEVFVHGALCMSVSGQCYISSMIGTRSGNRGSCAGTCRLPFSSTSKPAYDLSLKDLCLADDIKKLMDINVTSFKIEGRMKRPEYVAAAGDTYYKAIHSLDFTTDTLKAVFSRSGFTNGYLEDKIGKDMFGTRQKEDVVSATNKLLKELENSYKKEHGRIELNFEFEMKKDKETKLKATDVDGNTATIYGDIPEIALNKPSTYDSVSRSLFKLGGTIFKEGTLKADIDDGLILPASKLNEMRRAVCEEIINKRSVIDEIEFNRKDIVVEEKIFEGSLKLRAHFNKFEQIPFDEINELEFFSLPIDEVVKNKDKLFDYQSKVLIEPDRVMFMTEQDNIKKLEELKKLGFQNILCNNLAHIKIGNELGYHLYGGAYLNISNSLAVKEYEKLNLKDITLSFELDIQSISKIKSTIEKGVIAYGYLPLMITRNCPIRNQFSCKDCKGQKSLTDRMNKQFKVICNLQKYSEILNCNPLYMADRLNEFKNTSFASLYFTVEDKLSCKETIDNYIKKIPPKGDFTRGLYYRTV